MCICLEHIYQILLYWWILNSVSQLSCIGIHLSLSLSPHTHTHTHTYICIYHFIRYLFHVQVPRESLLFVIPAFGGVVSWEGEGAPFKEADQSITYQVCYSMRMHMDIRKQKFLI